MTHLMSAVRLTFELEELNLGFEHCLSAKSTTTGLPTDAASRFERSPIANSVLGLALSVLS